MNNKPSSKKSVIIIIVIIVAAGLAYLYYEGSQPATTSTLNQSVVTDQAIGAQVLALLNQIRTLRIDTALFQSAAYQSLRDYTVAIPPQEVGRDNPFAPLSGSGGATSTRR